MTMLQEEIHPKFTQTRKLQQSFDKLLDTQDVATIFKRSPMTIQNWRCNRKGLKQIPHVMIPGTKRPSIRFLKEDVVEWAKVNKVPMTLKKLNTKKVKTS